MDRLPPVAGHLFMRVSRLPRRECVLLAVVLLLLTVVPAAIAASRWSEDLDR